VDLICIDYFPDTGIDYDYAGSGFACTAPSLTTSATHRLLPRYQGRKLDPTDLIHSIN
jgi:hypothetical protein